MVNKGVDPTPKGGTIKKRCDEMGCWGEYLARREQLKREGMQPRESACRAYKDCRIEERWQDYQARKFRGELLGKGAPLTPGEMKEVKPDYQAPSPTRGAEVGESAMSLPEQIRWVKQQLAKVRNGGDEPQVFPNADALYWYQISISRPTDFDKIVLKIESPDKDAEDLMMRDGEYQFSQIEKQLLEAREEVGAQLREYETEFIEPCEPVLPVGSEGAGVEPVVEA